MAKRKKNSGQLPDVGINMDEHSYQILSDLHQSIYAKHPDVLNTFETLLSILEKAGTERPLQLKKKDRNKQNILDGKWFLSNQLCGMSLYVDRFCGNLSNLKNKLSYFEELGVNFLHLMPLFESPEMESDGGYAVSDFKKIDPKFGTIEDLKALHEKLVEKDMYLMLDIVLNHASDKHRWAELAKAGDKKYQDYFYFFDDRNIPDELEKTMPEIFPESSPGNFTYLPELDKWVMTVFHDYQWDLNFRNPNVFNEMLQVILFYANLGVDVLRIDAPAFIWKQAGTTSQNLDEAHILLRLIKQCVMIATPGMALLGEAIVSPAEIMKYFGEENFIARECDIAYNATQMALGWDAIATGEVAVMMAAQESLLKKPFGTTWLNYTRCHDDIGLGYDDEMILTAGFNPYEHRSFIKDYYSQKYPASWAKGALFSVNQETGDARISGTLASLCGLEKSIELKDENEIEKSIDKIIMLQSISFFIGGIPMLFYGDEKGYTNQYDFLKDNGKSHDNRWMHRPTINWGITEVSTIEEKIFSLTKKLINIRKKISVVADLKNLTWINTNNKHVVGFIRAWEDDRIYCLYNFSEYSQNISWQFFKKNNLVPKYLTDHWSGQYFTVGSDTEFLRILPYQFYILEPTK